MNLGALIERTVWKAASGATPAHATMLALRRSLGAAIAGLAAGVLLAPLAVRVLKGYLYGVGVADLGADAAAMIAVLILCDLATFAAMHRLRRANLAGVLQSE